MRLESASLGQETEKCPLSLQWRIDSAATSTYEIGNPPDYRGQSCMKKHGVPMSHVARQVPHLNLKEHTCVLCSSG